MGHPHARRSATRTVALWDPGGISTLRPAGRLEDDVGMTNCSREVAPLRLLYGTDYTCCRCRVVFKFTAWGFLARTHIRLPCVWLTHPDFGIRSLGSLRRCSPVTALSNGSLTQLLRAVSFSFPGDKTGDTLKWKIWLLVLSFAFEQYVELSSLATTLDTSASHSTLVRKDEEDIKRY